MMDPARQQVIDDVIHDAHFRRTEIVTSEVAAEIVDELQGMEAAGQTWIADYLDDLAAKGAQKVYADWRRRYRVDGRTKKGTEHAVVIKFDPDVSASLEGRLQALVDPEEALRIAANIITHAKSAMQRQIWDLKAGECETCSNSRFVDGKRSMREHCPDCVPKTRINPPTTAKVAELMAEVL